MTSHYANWLKTLTDMLSPWSVEEARVPWIAVLGQIALALFVAMLIHRFGTAILRRVTARLPFSRRLVAYGHLTGWLVVSLYFIQLALEDAPNTMSGIGAARHLNAACLIAALTWLGVRCVRAIADTVVELNPSVHGVNIQARRIQTQSRVLAQIASALLILIGLGMAFSTLPGMRQIGTTLLASAGAAGLLAGFAAKPVLGNLLAGMQIALTQPISIGDVVIVENEWGWIDEITGTYVVVRIWDDRRMIVPLQWFIEHPFQNWTRNQTAILGTVSLWADYGMPVEALRKEAERLCRASPEWDQRVCVVQVVEASERAMQIRVLLSAGDAGLCWDLRCRLREGLMAFVHQKYPQFLPCVRAELNTRDFGKA